MYSLIERTNSLGAYYEKYYNDEKLLTVKITSFQKKVTDFTYLILIGTYGEVNSPVYRYLNVYLGDSEWKTREKALYALKLFYFYIELFNLRDLETFSKADLKRLIYFLRGQKKMGHDYVFNTETSRADSTVNQYIGIYRDFFSFLGHKDSVLFDVKQTTKVLKTSTTSAGYSTTSEKYSSTLDVPKSSDIPLYIRVYEYSKIMNLIKTSNNKNLLRTKIIIKLMFEYGMRIAEVLGLTFEDIKPTKQKDYYKLILRNRLTDKQHQKCKRLYNPKDESSYKDDKYKTFKVGYNEVTIHSDLKELIDEYISESRDVFTLSKTAFKNLKRTKADLVENNSSIKENYYIFISKNYTPLSISGWNKIIKEIFLKVGLQVDTESKSTNLNHRFRHGFAMMCVKAGIDKFTLKELLRHKHVSTVDIYYNPTLEDKLETAVEVSKIIRTTLGYNKENL